MKDAITSRIEHFLAKIAGRNVDITTLTPPVASDMTELLLSEIADRLDSMAGQGGSGGGAGGLSVSMQILDDTGEDVVFALDHTFEEIANAYPNVYIFSDDGIGWRYEVPSEIGSKMFEDEQSGEEYEKFYITIPNIEFTADSETDYPIYFATDIRPSPGGDFFM